MKPYFSTALGSLYNVDCLEFMKTMEDKSIDLVLTDPPYGINKDFANDDLNEEEITLMWKGFIFQVSTKMKEGSNLLIEVPKNRNFYWQCFNCLKYEYCLALITTNAMRQCKVGYNDFSLCLWFSKNGGKIYKRYKDGIKTSFVNNGDSFKHPSPKNVNHYQRLIDMFSDKEHIVLDPFIGSGTTAVACEQLNRRWIGCEISEKYCEIAAKRIKAEYNQIKMF